MKTQKSKVEILKDARAAISDPDRWIKGDASEVRNGKLCLCTLGALTMATGGGPVGEARLALVAVLPVGFGSTLISEFNDDPDTTHADVLALFDRAIAAAEKCHA